MPRRTAQGRTLDLFEEGHSAVLRRPDLDWPKPERFPLNLDHRTVRTVVAQDLRESRDPLIVTGFAALDELIEFVADSGEAQDRIRVLLGNEPFPSRQAEYRVHGASFPREVEHYWLERGISLLKSATLIRCIELLQSGRVAARYLSESGERLHAKIYCADEAITLGSSNFTRPGLDRQLEANARFVRATEKRRYEDLRAIAENYWTLGRDYSAELLRLLEQLLQVVSWEEALARACAELLEGDWAREWMDDDLLPAEVELWPSQRQGIAQALYILTRQGSVLVADATGSGKTRMGAHLVRAITHQILRSGRLRRGKALMVCPPPVVDAWKREAHFSGAYVDVYSHGTLSHGRSREHDLLIAALRRAQVLCVDEGHNFLNIGSNRTQEILRNMADHVLLFTATPINRSIVDLLRIADTLGADNLEPSTLEAFEKMLAGGPINRTLTEDELKVLRGEIRRFTLRRTKRMLNTLIKREPERYRDASGNPCRFPEHEPRIYALDEPSADRALATEIRELAGQLLGVTHFQKPIELPEVLRRQGWTEEKYLHGRLESARKLSRYVVMSSLRSSRAALIEHIEGTQKATSLLKLTRYRRQHGSGHIRSTIEGLKGRVPENRLSIPLPDWLSDENAHRNACKRDHQTYVGILRLVARMSDHREQAKAGKLLELIAQHDLVLAFDSRPITLAWLAQIIGERSPKTKTLIASGDPGTRRQDLLRDFAPGSEVRGVIGLCSDSVSEGVNLQQASCMVHLDMPSVVRIAEQRVGRIDRMDSPHRSIEAWWPEDAPEFALSTDERFIERYETVENLLGSNMPLPDELQRPRGKPVDAQTMIAEFEKEAEQQRWDGIEDAFEPVRGLVAGDHPLVTEDIYERYRTVETRVLSRVSLVKARSPWAFFCIAAGTGGAPRWVLFPRLMTKPVTQLDAVAQGLRERLTPQIESLKMDERASETLGRFLRELAKAERELLSRRKQRALEEMDKVLENYLKEAAGKGEQEQLKRFRTLREMLRRPNPEHQPDWDEVASRWLDLIRPVWYERLKARRRRRPLLLKDIRKDLLSMCSTFGPEVIEKFESFPVLSPPDERIRACIVGVA